MHDRGGGGGGGPLLDSLIVRTSFTAIVFGARRDSSAAKVLKNIESRIKARAL